MNQGCSCCTLFIVGWQTHKKELRVYEYAIPRGTGDGTSKGLDPFWCLPSRTRI